MATLTHYFQWHLKWKKRWELDLWSATNYIYIYDAATYPYIPIHGLLPWKRATWTGVALILSIGKGAYSESFPLCPPCSIHVRRSCFFNSANKLVPETHGDSRCTTRPISSASLTQTMANRDGNTPPFIFSSLFPTLLLLHSSYLLTGNRCEDNSVPELVASSWGQLHPELSF